MDIKSKDIGRATAVYKCLSLCCRIGRPSQLFTELGNGKLCKSIVHQQDERDDYINDYIAFRIVHQLDERDD